ncbi:MAG: hypothetical protein ACK4Q5_19735 [Saprospiraceae bacterium]
MGNQSLCFSFSGGKGSKAPENTPFGIFASLFPKSRFSISGFASFLKEKPCYSAIFKIESPTAPAQF